MVKSFKPYDHRISAKLPEWRACYKQKRNNKSPRDNFPFARIHSYAMSPRMVTIYGIQKRKKKFWYNPNSGILWTMVWERSNKRDWDLHLKDGLFKSFYLCTHRHCLPDVSTNQFTCHAIFTNWNSPHMQACVAIILPCSFSKVTHPKFASYCLSDYDPFTIRFVCTLSERLKTIMGLICRVKYFSINGFMTCKIIFVIFFLLKKCLDTILSVYWKNRLILLIFKTWEINSAHLKLKGSIALIG